MTIRVTSASSRQSVDRQLEEMVPLEDGEQVIVRAPIRLRRPYGAGPLTVLRTLIETSTRGALRLTDRRLVLLRVQMTGPNLVYDIPRSLIRGVEPAGGGYLRLLCDAKGLPPEMTGIKAGLTALEHGIAGGLAGGGALGAAVGGAGMVGAQGRRAEALAAILVQELGSAAAQG